MTAVEIHRQPWERQPGESVPAFEAFRLYRDDDHRTLEKVAKQLQKSMTMIARWSRKHHWVARCEAWDWEQDRRMLERREQERERMDREHREHGRYVRLQAMRRLAGADDADGQVDPIDWNTTELPDVLAALRTGAHLERQSVGLTVNAGTIPTAQARKVLNEAVALVLDFVPEEKRATAIRALQSYVEGVG